MNPMNNTFSLKLGDNDVVTVVRRALGLTCVVDTRMLNSEYAVMSSLHKIFQCFAEAQAKGCQYDKINVLYEPEDGCCTFKICFLETLHSMQDRAEVEAQEIHHKRALERVYDIANRIKQQARKWKERYLDEKERRESLEERFIDLQKQEQDTRRAFQKLYFKQLSSDFENNLLRTLLDRTKQELSEARTGQPPVSDSHGGVLWFERN